MIGVICMILITVMITLIYGNWMLALIVGFSILCTFGISAVIGSTIPLLINKLNLDPAIASGPFITTVNDIVGLLIYFSRSEERRVGKECSTQCDSDSII